MLRTVSAVFLSACLLLIVSGVAWAHVEVSPGEVEPGATRTFTVSVPTEKDIPTTRVSLQIPQGVEVGSVDAPSGWQGAVEGGSIVWSGGEIGAGESQEFAFEATLPDRAGTYAWPASQTYQDGSVVEWAGAPDSDEPAPVVEVGSHGGSHDEGESHGHEMETVPETGGVSLTFVYGLAALALIAAGAALSRAGNRR